jgi:hypothetical protein
MTTLALTITPTPRGWAVALTNGDQIARFSGPAAKCRAQRYLATYVKETRHNGR